MIRVYLDWNIISKLKLPGNDHIRTFLEAHSNSILIPFTPTHFRDSQKGGGHSHPKFQEDLDTMQKLCKDHFMQWRGDDVEPLLLTPRDFLKQFETWPKLDFTEVLDMDKALSTIDEMLEAAGKPPVGKIFKEMCEGYVITPTPLHEGSSILDEMFPVMFKKNTLWGILQELGPLAHSMFEGKATYKNMRMALTNSGHGMVHAPSPTSPAEGAERVDSFLNGTGLSQNFFEFVESTLKSTKQEPTRFNWFTHAYWLMDLLGYRSDKLEKKTDTFMNIGHDGEHALYAAYCDFLVTDDERMRDKASVIYHYLNRPTRIITLDQVIDEVGGRLHALPQGCDALAHLSSLLFRNGVEVERYPPEREHESDTVAKELEYPLFAFFTHGIHSEYIGKGEQLTLRKAFQNYSTFVYPSEFRAVLEKFLDVCGSSPGFDREARIANLMNGDPAMGMSCFNESDIAFVVDRDEDLWRPRMRLFHLFGESGENV